MLDTTPVTTAITRLISSGTTEQALLTVVAHLFPDLSLAELPGRDDRGRAASSRRH